MPRRGIVPRRKRLPDPIFHSELVSQFINRLMVHGKKHKAQTIFYKAMEIIKERSGEQEPLSVFERAIENVKPSLQVRPRRMGGQTYQVPVEVRQDCRATLACRWLIEAARRRPGKSMQEKLSAELIEAAQNSGAAVKRKEDMHKMAEANRAFAHYRW